MNQKKWKNNNYIVALYIRSDIRSDNKMEKKCIKEQRKILMDFVRKNNYEIYDEYVDEGYSGTNFNRPNFKRMIKDIKSGKVNMVISKDLNKLGRNYLETYEYLENGVRYISILDKVDTNLCEDFFILSKILKNINALQRKDEK